MSPRHLWAAACGALACASLHGAQSYDSGTIPEALRGGVAVVRNYELSFDRPTITTASQRETLAITVLDGDGDDAAGFNMVTDNNSSLKSFSGEIFDSRGNSVRRIKKQDLGSTELSEGLASDYTTYYYQPHYASYPYTVKYEWEINYRDGILAFPTFNPMPGSQCAVEKAVYRLTLPSGTMFHPRSFNMASDPEKRSAGGNDIYEWKLENTPGIVYEPFAPPVTERYPMVYFSPHEFSFNGIAGCMDDWSGYGQWQWKLLAGRNVLPDALKAEIDKMTTGAATPMEKIKILYDYLAATTRYVSIQIGIGGLQPMAAAEVYKNKFGDCKGLSNYMQAMLAYCGIDSYYTEIGAGSLRILPDFANVMFSNHVILQVPVGNDTLWLECTNPRLPLGYIHDDIAGRYGLVYRDGTARPVKLGSYPDSLHLIETKAAINLSAAGSFKGHVVKNYHFDRYVDNMDFASLGNDERVNRIASWTGVAAPRISSVSYTETKSISPVSTVSYDLEALQLGSRTGSRLFISVTPLRTKSGMKLGKSARKFPIVVEGGGINREEDSIALPAGMSVEALPAPVAIDSKFGDYSLTVLPGKSGIVIKRSFLLRSGRYDAGDYADFKSFMDAVAQADSGGIVLKMD